MAFRSEDPPNSRLFILCQKGVSEKEFRDRFGEYGKIEDIWIVKDKRTNEDRGKSTNFRFTVKIHAHGFNGTHGEGYALLTEYTLFASWVTGKYTSFA